MYCVNCGQKLNDNAAYCLGCGAVASKPNTEKTTGTGLWWWIGFLIPIAGFLMWALCGEKQPRHAKSAGMGALIGAVVCVVVAIVCYVLWIGLFIFSMQGLYV